jgi:hypothetical protein
MTDYKIKYLKYKKKYLNLKKSQNLTGGAPTKESLNEALRTIGVKMGHATLLVNTKQDKTLKQIKLEFPSLEVAVDTIINYIIDEIEIKDLADLIVSNRAGKIMEKLRATCTEKNNITSQNLSKLSRGVNDLATRFPNM